MRARFLRALALAGVALVGCGSKTGLKVPPGTATFVVTQVFIGDTPPDNVTPAAGFNVDGLFTRENIPMASIGGCFKHDSPSYFDPLENCPLESLNAVEGTCAVSSGCSRPAACAGGVDNYLPAVLDAIGSTLPVVVPTGLRGVIRDAFLARQSAVIVRVTGIDDVENDPHVTLFVYEGRRVDECADVGDNRRYAVLTSSVRDRDLDRPVIAPLPASIRGGRVVPVRGATTTIPLSYFAPAEWLSAVSQLENARLSFSIDERGNGAGNIGGSVRGEALLRAVRTLLPERSATAIVGGFADIAVATSTGLVCFDRTATPPRLGDLGVGMLFALRRIDLDREPVDATPQDACAR
ncbi:MAG: hypothetical protein JNK05_24830 [Myxococcales bacterium]|nr:hypothetical protein [Myxococcales bacterium]